MNWLSKKTAEQYYLEGTTQSIKGNFKKAIKLLSKAIELLPEYQDAYIHRSIAYINQGENDHALADLNYVIEKNSGNDIAYYNRSIANMGFGKTDLALADIESAILLAPKEAEYYNHRSIIHSVREE